MIVTRETTFSESIWQEIVAEIAKIIKYGVSWNNSVESEFDLSFICVVCHPMKVS